VRIDLQVSAHLEEKIVANFLLSILNPAMAPLSLIRDETADYLVLPGKLPEASHEFRALH